MLILFSAAQKRKVAPAAEKYYDAEIVPTTLGGRYPEALLDIGSEQPQEELRELKSLDVLLPTRDKTIRLRMVATPEKHLIGAASKDEDTHPQQAKGNRECSGENGLICTVTY